MHHKKAQAIANVIIMFWSILFIIVALTLFILGSSIIKNLDHQEGGIVIADEKITGTENLFLYTHNLTKLSDVKARIHYEKKSLAEVLVEADYEQ